MYLNLGGSVKDPTHSLLVGFFNTSIGEPSKVSREDYISLEKYIKELVELGISLDETLITALSSGDYEFGGGPENSGWLAVKQILDNKNLAHIFFRISTIIDKYWVA